MSNSIDPDETAHYEPSHLDRCCLQKPILSPIAVKELTQSDRLKEKFYVSKYPEQESIGSIFLPPSQKIDSFGNICNILMTKLEL